MKFTMDEAMKHRLVGIAVILSIALIFVPAMIKKNNQRLEEKRVIVELPAKPPQPEVAEVDEPAVFEATKVAHVNLDTQKTLSDTAIKISKHDIDAPKAIHVAAQSNLKSAKKHPVVKKTMAKVEKNKLIKLAKNESSHKQLSRQKEAQHHTTKRAKRETNRAKARATHANYAVQIGVFSQGSNAKLLQNKLKELGYHSRTVSTNYHGKTAVKVLVGRLSSAQQARQLKVQLAQEQHLRGFVVKGVA